MAPRFREGLTHRAGSDPALLMLAKVVGVNPGNWTVDVRSKYDGHRYYNIQVGSPYLHYNNGEGLSILPELGATCIVGIPGDTSGPVVFTFVAPSESTDEGGNTSAAGRPKYVPGDICLTTRDGNFLRVLRGGVVQIGATELAQRIYIPIGNLITDVSENYTHHNTCGTVHWGIQEGPSTENIGARYTQTYRVHANDKYADIRVAVGKVDPIAEPQDAKVFAELQRLGFGEAPTVYEVTLAPGGFEAGTGAPVADARNLTKFRYFLDRKGNTFIRAEGNVLAVFQKEVVIYARKGVTLHCEKGFGLQVKQDLEVEAKGYMHLKGGIVKLGKGTTPVARQGDPVIMTIPAAQITAMSPVGPITGVITMMSPVMGAIMSGSSEVLA